MVSDAQVRLMRQKRMDGKTQEAAAAASSMSVRTAREWESGPVPSATVRSRDWRTRVNPFDGVWVTDVEPLLQRDTKGVLEAKWVLELLRTRYPDQFHAGQARTLQRRFRDWRARYGPEPEVYFEQVAVPGREAAIDFTHAEELGITIAGAAFPHLLFEFVLSYSHWTYVSIAFGETFEALVAGVQGALWALGGVPEVLRSDNLSAATHELKASSGRDLTTRFRAVLDHYRLRSTRITPGRGHENGVVEQAHRRLKALVAQALLVRGHADFTEVAAYDAFVQNVVASWRNRPAADRLAEERLALRPLPSAAIPAYTTYHPVVRRWSTIRIAHRTYSVPATLMGHTVEARVHPNVVEVHHQGRLVQSMPRLRKEEAHHIDYRHVIGWLVRKPGAFARYRYREDLYPSLVFRRAYDALVRHHGERADIEYLRILQLASTAGEARVVAVLALCVDQIGGFDYVTVQTQVAPPVLTVPIIQIPVPDLAVYDALRAGAAA
ncbi:MAG: IS21 family transposase [Planctomycetes bacterium]|nr:IS21 family transposase [Planctomycetota bacterium]